MKSIKRKKLADSVIEEIQRMMQSGELKEGDKLPNQNEFAAQLGVSRPSLREALITLTLLGIIEQKPGLGTVIRRRMPDLFADKIKLPLVSDHKTTVKLIEARRCLETGIVELAVEKATADDIKQMRRLVSDMTKALQEGRIKDYIDFDMDFHYKVASSSHNDFLVHLLLTLRGPMDQFMRDIFSVLPGLLERSLKFHKAIYQSIKERNAGEAFFNMKKHIVDIQQAVDLYYERTG